MLCNLSAILQDLYLSRQLIYVIKTADKIQNFEVKEDPPFSYPILVYASLHPPSPCIIKVIIDNNKPKQFGIKIKESD